MIITIDGPAGAGKSTVARALARRLGFEFLDTGAMYRAVTWAALERGILGTGGEVDEAALAAMLDGVQLEVAGGATSLNGQDVSVRIRSAEVTHNVRYLAERPAVRDRLVALQRACGERRNMVTEGRDQGTVVFPRAECKFFLTASLDERARRRQAEFAGSGRKVSLEEVRCEMDQRDDRDRSRSLAPLAPAPDAISIDTTFRDIAATVELLEARVRERWDQAAS